MCRAHTSSSIHIFAVLRKSRIHIKPIRACRPYYVPTKICWQGERERGASIIWPPSSVAAAWSHEYLWPAALSNTVFSSWRIQTKLREYLTNVPTSQPLTHTKCSAQQVRLIVHNAAEDGWAGDRSEIFVAVGMSGTNERGRKDLGRKEAASGGERWKGVMESEVRRGGFDVKSDQSSVSARKIGGWIWPDLCGISRGLRLQWHWWDWQKCHCSRLYRIRWFALWEGPFWEQKPVTVSNCPFNRSYLNCESIKDEMFTHLPCNLAEKEFWDRQKDGEWDGWTETWDDLLFSLSQFSSQRMTIGTGQHSAGSISVKRAPL